MINVLDRFPTENRPFLARGAALKLWGCRDEEILIEGPAGTGKTRALLEKIHYCLTKYPGARALIVRKTRESMTESVLVTFEMKVLLADSPLILGPQRNLRQHYVYDNGSELIVGGMDKSSKVMSTEYDIIGVFEGTELTEEDLENLTTRLRNGVMPYQQIIVDCNPGPPQHWLNRRAAHGKMTRLLSRHKDNPVLWIKERDEWTKAGLKYLEKLKRLSGARKSRLLEGKWAAQEGMVYEEYDAAINVIDKFPIPIHWRRIRTVDFGYRNPFVCQWWAINPDGDMFLYRELYRTGVTVKVHAQRIRELSVGEKYEDLVTDHDAEDRATLEEEGLHSIPAHKEILRGIEAVKLRLPPQGPNKKPRLSIFRNCLVEPDEELREAKLPLCTEQEFDGYIYRLAVDGKPIKEEPLDKDNHGMDAMRYAVAYVDNLPGMTIQVVAAEASVIRLDQVKPYGTQN